MVTDEMVKHAASLIRGGSTFSQDDREEMARSILEAALSAAEPVSSRNDEAGYVEFLNQDVPYVVRDIQGAVAILMDLETRNVIGYRVYNPDSVFAPPAPSVAVKALPDMPHILKGCVDMLKAHGFGSANIVEVAERALSAQVQDVAGEELTTEIVNLRAALKPFAEAADYYSDGLHRTKAEDALPCGPALTVGHLRRAKNALSAKVNCAADAETKTRFHIEWIAVARPPVHPKPMTGRATFETFERAVQHLRNQADDAQFVALKERRTTVVTVDRSADMRAVLPAAPAKQEG